MVGLAYGIAMSVSSLFYMAGPVLSGYIHDHTLGVDYGYFWVEIFVICLYCVTFIPNFGLFLYDRKHGRVLAISEAQANKYPSTLTVPRDREEEGDATDHEDTTVEKTDQEGRQCCEQDHNQKRDQKEEQEQSHSHSQNNKEKQSLDAVAA